MTEDELRRLALQQPTVTAAAAALREADAAAAAAARTLRTVYQEALDELRQEQTHAAATVE